MRSNNCYGSRAAPARGFVALFALMLAMGLALAASPTAAAPFAYVANNGDSTVSVIDTATNMVVATFAGPPSFFGLNWVAVTPDGTHVYVTGGDVYAIDTATNMVVATVGVGTFSQGVAITPDGKYAYVTVPSPPSDVAVIATATNTGVAGISLPNMGLEGGNGVAITPDGKHAYVANAAFNTVLVIDTATNTFVGTPIPVGSNPEWVAVAPDGKHAYVANFGSNNVSVIDTATNTVVTTVPVGSKPNGVAVAPDGKHAYVANFGSNNVSVIATATNTVVTTVPVGSTPNGIAVTPDGKYAYVTNFNSNNVSVIDTATNTVVTTVAVGVSPLGVGIVPPPPGVPFLDFSAKLAIDLEHNSNKDRFELQSHFTLSSTAPTIDPVVEPVALQIGTFSITIPPGSFKKHQGENEGEFFTFRGVIDGVRLEALIRQTGTLRYAFNAKARDANLAGTVNTVYVTLIIGDNSGATSVTADIDH